MINGTGMTGESAMRALVASSPDALWVLDVEGRTLFANERFARLVGRELRDIDERIGDAMHDEQGRVYFEAHLEQMRSGHPGLDNIDVLVKRPDGSSIWTLVSWAPFRDDAGEVIGYLHRLTEYTERHRLVETLQQREQQLGEAQKIARIGSYTWDVPADVLRWSDQVFLMHSTDPAQFEGSFGAFLDGVHPDDRERIRTLVTEALAGADDYTWEGRVLAPDGVIRWVRGVGIVERDDAGAVQRVHGTTQDITDIAQASQAAFEANRRLSLLQQIAEASNRSSTLPDALVRSARVMMEHSSWRPVVTWVRGRDGTLSALELPEATDPHLAPADYERAAATWESRTADVHPLPDFPGHSLVTLPILGASDTVACVIQLDADEVAPDEFSWSLLGQIQDQLRRVAERERSAVQLADARDEAMEASRHKSEFLAMMSHEIRTPMNGVIGLTDLLLRTPLDEGQQRLADGLHGAGLTLLTLINDILDLSKIESGRLELETTDFDVRSVVDQTSIVLAGPAQEKGIELVVACDPDLPRRLVGDPVRFGQVITNLGSNAVKFTDTGEVVVEAGVISRDERGVLVRVEVRDTGIGLDSSTADSLFDAFTQADLSTTRRHGGTGLGLAISRRLVEEMGGEIGVQSEVGRGSTFWFTARLGVAPDQPVASTRPLQHRRVLVVDDNATAARFAVRQLQAWDIEAEALTDPAATVDVLRKAAEDHPFDAVLVDLEMPGDNGLQLGQVIREHEELADVALVLLAGDQSTSVEEIDAAGFGAWVSKPVRASALHDALLDVTVQDRTPLSTPRARPQPAPLALSVLVVEDNRVNQLVATGLLESLGCDVAVVGDGRQAVQALAPGHAFDVVLMDCRMPEMDGFDATRAVRAAEAEARAPRVPIIAMTASALAGERERCEDAGMDDFLAKPVDPAQVATTLRRWRDRARRPEPAPVAEAAQAPESAVLDPERVAMLAELVKDGVSFFERTRMSFLARIDSTLAELRIAADDDDAPAAHAMAHQLKGSAANLGLQRVAAAAAQIEALAAGGSLSGVVELIERLAQALGEGVEALVAVTAGGDPRR